MEKKKINEKLKLLSIENELVLKMIVYVVLFVVYIFPTGLINDSIPIDKFIFSIATLTVYICNVIIRNKIKKQEIFFIISIIVFCIVARNINYVLFLPILLLDDLLNNKEKIIKVLKKSPILYICLGFTILYSIINWGKNGRYAYSAIMEVNQSGLAIFCLALLLMNKNKKIGTMSLIFGLLTVSRSYYLAILIYIVSKIKIIKKVVTKDIVIKLCNYNNLTIISSIGLIVLGALYIQQYKAGNIYWGDEVSSRLYTFFDYSNFFRFASIMVLALIFVKFPMKLITGMNTQEYINASTSVCNELEIPYKYVTPHNLFYSHLKIYGSFSIIETIYISMILKKIVNKENFFIYIAIVLYSFILGAGLYSYWLYISFFVLILNERTVFGNESINNR